MSNGSKQESKWRTDDRRCRECGLFHSTYTFVDQLRSGSTLTNGTGVSTDKYTTDSIKKQHNNIADKKKYRNELAEKVERKASLDVIIIINMITPRFSCFSVWLCLVGQQLIILFGIRLWFSHLPFRLAVVKVLHVNHFMI